jgi:hypothetical protein
MLTQVAIAQAETAQISGSVLDQTNAVVPNADISARQRLFAKNENEQSRYVRPHESAARILLRLSRSCRLLPHDEILISKGLFAVLMRAHGALFSR